MKILMNDKKESTLLVQITYKELANLTGFYGVNSHGFKMAENGKEIDVCSLYNDMGKLKELQEDLAKVEQLAMQAYELVKKVKEK